MPRYYFQVRDGESLPDREGTDLPDYYAAQVEALSTAGELLRDLGANFWNRAEWRMEVTDEQGRVLFVLRFSAEERLCDGQVPLADPPAS